MTYRQLGSTGKNASVLCMGSTSFGTDLSEGLVFDILDAFCALGGNFIDTARVYGDFAREIGGIAEGVIGRWMGQRGNRESLVLSTKGGHPRLRHMHTGRLDRQCVREDLALSLDALGTEYVDMYWLHRDDVDKPVGEILNTLNEILCEGRARAIGASNWTHERIREANRYAREHALTGFSANQPQWSLARLMQGEDDTLCQMSQGMYDFHRETNLACVPYSAQAKGFFTKLYEGGEEGLSPKARDRFLSEENLKIYREVLRIREETGASVGAIALAYLTGQPFPVFPIVGVSRLSQVDALREAGDLTLNEADREALRALASLGA